MRSGFHELVVIETGLNIPSVNSGDETLTLNVTTNTILSTNMHYHAILITTMDMVYRSRRLSVLYVSVQ